MAEDTTVVETGDAGSGSEKTADTTGTTAEALNARIKELSDRLASEGRSKAQVKADKDALEATVAQLKASDQAKSRRIAQIEQWYYENVAPEQEKVTWQRAQDVKRMASVQAEAGRSQVLEIILNEDDADVRKALREAVDEAASAGEPMGPTAVSTLRKQLTKAAKANKSVDTTEAQEKEPPAVSGAKSTGGKGPTLEDQLAEAVTKRDAVAIINIRSQIAARNAQLARG